MTLTWVSSTALSASSEYSARVLTRDPSSARAKQLASLPNVTLIQGTQDSQADLHRAFKGVYGAWVNLDGFVLGEMKELFFAFRAYEIARHEGVKHYVWANCDYALRIAGWREEFHWGHNDAKGRVGGEFALCVVPGFMPVAVQIVHAGADCRQISSSRRIKRPWRRRCSLSDLTWICSWTACSCLQKSMRMGHWSGRIHPVGESGRGRLPIRADRV